MLRFKVFENGRPAASAFTDGSYLVGSDGVPLPAQIGFVEGEIRCNKRAPGPAGLNLLWNVEGYGRLMLETAVTVTSCSVVAVNSGCKLDWATTRRV